MTKQEVKVNFKDESSKTAEEWAETGTMLKENQWLEDALEAYRNGLKVAKNNEMKGKLYRKMGSAYRTKGDNKKSEEYFKKAIKTDPKSVYPYIYIEFIY
ncbi:MAG: tetratricopeptide repeat protein [Fusobacteriota bacterium]